MNGEQEAVYGNLTPVMNILNRFCRSMLVICYALFPPHTEDAIQSSRDKAKPQKKHTATTREELRFYLGDLNRGVDLHGEMELCFPGCFAIVSPFLLFRLKRGGFSNCRVLMSEEGLLLTALR